MNSTTHRIPNVLQKEVVMNKRLGTLIAALVLAAATEVSGAGVPTPQPKPQPNPKPVPCPTWKRCAPAPLPCGVPGSVPCRRGLSLSMAAIP